MRTTTNATGWLRSWRVATLSGLVLIAVACSTAAQDVWRWSTPLPQGNGLRAVAFNGTTHVAIGDRGTILSSPDAITWTPRQVHSRAYLRDVAWGSNRFVAVGWAGGLLTSVDGFDWTEHTQSSSLRPSRIASDGTRFVSTVDDGRTLLISDDGETWTTLLIDQDYAGSILFKDVQWTGTQFVVMAGTGPYYISDTTLYFSSNGHDWTSQQLAGVAPDTLAAKGDQLVVVGRTAAFEWRAYEKKGSEQWSSAPFPAVDNRDMATGGGRFVVVGYRNGVDPALVYVSSDGLHWSGHEVDHAGEIAGVTWTGTQFVLVGEDGFIATSPDGESWTPRRQGVLTNLEVVRWLGDEYVALGFLGPSLRSPDSRHWTPFTIDNFWGGPLNDIARAVTMFGERSVAVGYKSIFFSPDRSTWWPVPPATTGNIYINSVTWGKGKFVAVGDLGTVQTSEDGMQWTLRSSNTFKQLKRVVFNGEIFVAVGTWLDGGAIVTSPDGINWTVRFSTEDGQFEGPRDVCWNGKRFVATAAANVMTSNDGIAWETHPTGLPYFAFDHLAWDGHRFMGVGFSIVTSPDGIQWTQQPDSPLHYLEGAASDGSGEFVAVYSNAVLRTGDDLFADGME